MDQADKDYIIAAIEKFGKSDPYHEIKPLTVNEVKNYAELLGSGRLPTEDLDVAWLLLTIVKGVA